MPVFVLDAGGLSRLAERSLRASALLAALRREDLWPPLVPSPVPAECLTGHAGRDANVNRLYTLVALIMRCQDPFSSWRTSQR